MHPDLNAHTHLASDSTSTTAYTTTGTATITENPIYVHDGLYEASPIRNSNYSISVSDLLVDMASRTSPGFEEEMKTRLDNIDQKLDKMLGIYKIIAEKIDQKLTWEDFIFGNNEENNIY